MGASRNELRELSSQIDALFDLGKREEAATLLNQAITDSAGDGAYNLFFLGEAAGYLERDIRKQKSYLLQAYQLEENDPYIVKNLGVYYLINDSERKAIKLFDKAIELDPNDFESFRNKGLALSNLGREKKAMEWFAKAVAINHLDYDAIRQTGISLSKLGKDGEAIEWFRKALAVNENDYDSMRQLGISLAMLGKYETAVGVLKLALSVNPNDYESKRNLNLVLRKMSGEGETFLSRTLNYLGRKLASAWRRLINQL
ncbi:MAG: tetratricopeptide repeat protein [Desulfuromonadaceae bacterium]